MFSNFNESTSIRLNGVDPVAEDKTVPALRQRISDGDPRSLLVEPGQILIPDLLAKGMKVKTGDSVVLVATNASGSVNGKNFIVRGVLEAVTSPGGHYVISAMPGSCCGWSSRILWKSRSACTT